MAFYRQDLEMAARLEAVLDELDADGRPGLRNSLSITWIRYENVDSDQGFGACWREDRFVYPASVVKLFYAVACEQWLQRDLLLDCDELRRAMREMIGKSSNDATGLVLDLLTGTTSGPELYGERWENWIKQRQLINNWLFSIDWPEFVGINCCQKTWGDAPYGREKQFYGSDNSNRNALSTAATARMLEAVMKGWMVSPPACRRLRKLLDRSLDSEQRRVDPDNQVDGFLGEGLPEGSRLWSKAGWMSQARHDAAWWIVPDQPPMLVVVFCLGSDRAKDHTLLPEIASHLSLFKPSQV